MHPLLRTTLALVAVGLPAACQDKAGPGHTAAPIDLAAAGWRPTCSALQCNSSEICAGLCNGADGCVCKPDGGSCLPSCSLLALVVAAGQKDSVTFAGLQASSPFTVQIGGGPPLVAGTTDCSGGATIEFVVPSTVTPALHLVDVIISGTAITAECVLRVVAN